MAKRNPDKRNPSKASRHPKAGSREEKGRKGRNHFPLVVAVLVLLGLGGSYLFARSARKASSGARGPQSVQVATATDSPGESGWKWKETRPTLSPSRFTGRTARAYQVAREIPEVLDQLYCYCHCQESLGHKSLLTCYVDNHAAGCDICMNEALAASAYTKRGYSIAEIKERLARQYKS